MTGKVTPDDLIEGVFTRTGADDPAVLQGPADGEDAAAIDPGEGTLVVILVAVILLLTSLCYLRRQTLFAWILSSSFHVLTATSISSDPISLAASHHQNRQLFTHHIPRKPREAESKLVVWNKFIYVAAFGYRCL